MRLGSQGGERGPPGLVFSWGLSSRCGPGRPCMHPFRGRNEEEERKQSLLLLQSGPGLRHREEAVLLDFCLAQSLPPPSAGSVGENC